MKNVFFWWSPHFPAFEPPDYNPLKKIHAIPMASHPPPTPQNKSKSHMNAVVNN